MRASGAGSRYEAIVITSPGVGPRLGRGQGASVGRFVLHMSKSIPQVAEIRAGSLRDWLLRQLRNALASWDAAMGRVRDPVAAPNGRNLRAAARQRTYLCSGRLAKLDSTFISECQIRDRSDTGARLRLRTNAKLPAQIRLFDDLRLSIETADIVWQRNREIGIRFLPELNRRLKQTYRISGSGKLYVVRR
ncbi:PilZ domain-containing protein [Rhizobiales bacterium GAS191]|nr:PilZ domain-containing protein [Rhizobiales bacterium GAS191]